jgi:hypothetical protein
LIVDGRKKRESIPAVEEKSPFWEIFGTEKKKRG